MHLNVGIANKCSPRFGGLKTSRYLLVDLGAYRHFFCTPTRNASSKSSAKAVKPPIYKFGNFLKLQTPDSKQTGYTAKSIENIKSFDELKIFPSVRTAMIHDIKHNYNLKNTYIKSKDELVISPTPVQVASIRKINRSRAKMSKSKLEQGKQIYQELVNNLTNKLKVFTMAAETGSGKTWAYLSVILSKLKEDDLNSFNKNVGVYHESRNVPVVRSVILVPTNELIDQVFNTVQFANTVKLDMAANESSLILNDKKYKDFLAMEEENGLNLNILKWGAGEPASKFFGAVQKNTIDILITTPTKLQSLGKQHSTDQNPYRFLYNVQYCVVDEADTLFDPSWVNDTMAILNKFSKAKDLILCSATMPKKFVKTVERYFKDLTIDVVTPSLHKLPKQIHVKIIDSQLSPFNGSKTRCLAQALYAIQKDGTEHGFVKRVIVFVNHKKDVMPLVSVLTTKYHQDPETIVGLSGDDSPIDRAGKIKPFISKPQELPEGVSLKLQILVTTDLFARGVNFNGIKNVILMDFPNNSVDLVHRIGRTGRMRQSGRVFIITDKKTSKSWVKSLPNATKQGIVIG